MTPEPARARPIEILLVEDSPTDALLTREALEQSKLLNNVHEVDNGVDALAFLRREGRYAGMPRPDLVLLDWNLPRKGGSEVLEEAKRDPQLRAIPIVVLSTSKAEEDVLRSYSLYANCFVTKPVDFNSFAQVVRSIREFWFSIVTLPTDVA
jgi:CheY-like chemotaxis protein